MRFECAAVIGALSLLACRSPTQIEVVVTTNVACPQVTGTTVTAGTLGEIESIPPTSTTADCVSERMGSVVLVPSGEDDALVGFKVVTAINGASVDLCVPDATGSYGANCIVARRALRYLPHTPLTVNVLMSGECAGKACDPQSTCVEGACVSATIGSSTACEGNGCDENVLEPNGEVPDATVPSEAGPNDASFDTTLEADAIADTSPPGDGPVTPNDSGPLPTVAGCDLGGAFANSPWPMEEYCPSHRNVSPLHGPTQAPTKPPWTRSFSQAILSAPSIGPDGTLYVGGGTEGTILALDPLTGNSVWTYAPDSGAQYVTMPILAADGTLRAVDLSQAGTYVRLDLDGGKYLGSASLGARSRSGITVITDGTQYTSDNSGYLIAFDPSGTVRWRAASVSSDYIFPTVLPDGTIAVANGNIHLVNPDGGVQWTYDAAAVNDLAVVSLAKDGTLRAYDTAGTLYALEPDGGLIWTAPTPIAYATQLAVANNGTTYVGNGDNLLAIDANGQDAGTFPGPCGQPIIDAVGNLFVLCDQNLYGLDATLAQIWSFAVPMQPGQAVNDSPVIGLDGAIYLTIDYEGPDGGPADVVMGFVQ